MLTMEKYRLPQLTLTLFTSVYSSTSIMTKDFAPWIQLTN